jgi:thymidylate synthase
MFTDFQGRTADEVWQKAADAFRAGDCFTAQTSRAGGTRELLHAAFSIYEPKQRWIVSREPPLNIAFALAEVVWIMAGRNDAAFLNYFNSQLPRFAGNCKTYHGAYGHRLRRHFGIDQLERAYLILKNKPYSRQVVLQLWDVKSDLPDDDGREKSPDVPCNVLSMLKVRDGKLEWTQIMRSNDLFRGLPHNIVQFTCLQEIIAGWLNLEVGSYHHISDSLHVYEIDFLHIENSHPCKVERNCDTLMCPKAKSEKYFCDMAKQVEQIINPEIVCGELMERILKLTLPAPYKNILLILSAEGSRKRKRTDLMQKLISECSNLAYRQMFSRWLKRVRCPDLEDIKT